MASVSEISTKSEELDFESVGRKIRRGCCLGQSKNGCVAYSGMDSKTGQLIYITEWNIKYTQLESKCMFNCPNENSGCNECSIDDIIQSIGEVTTQLVQLRHKNLITYEGVLCMKNSEGIIIYLAQDFVQGLNVGSISNSLGCSYAGASSVARSVLEILIYLRYKDVSHGNLNDATVFIDNKGVCRIGDFSLIPYLCKLIDVQRQTQGDLPALGDLIESLMLTQYDEKSDFIEKCKGWAMLPSDLRKHPFLMMRGHSKMNAEFVEIQLLGKGAYGHVLQGKNIFDELEYAIKCVELPDRDRRSYNYMKITREVELLSAMNHPNVVRYFSSWIENAVDPVVCKVNDDLSSDGIDNAAYLVRYAVSDDSSSDGIDNAEHPVHSAVSDDSSLDGIDNAVYPLHSAVSDDSSSDGIEFVNSDGKTVEYDLFDWSAVSSVKLPNPKLQIMYIQMEFCGGRTLRTAIDGGLYKNYVHKALLWREILNGLGYIHKLGIIHRDLKPDNIFLDENGHAKIGDFGVATTMGMQMYNSAKADALGYVDDRSTQMGEVGTPFYIAPELYDRATCDSKADVYSLGAVFFETTCEPFKTSAEKIARLNELRSPNVDKFGELDMIKRMLAHDPKERPTALELSEVELGIHPESTEEMKYILDLQKEIEVVMDMCSMARDMPMWNKFDFQKQIEFVMDMYSMVRGIPMWKNECVFSTWIDNIFRCNDSENVTTRSLVPKQ